MRTLWFGALLWSVPFAVGSVLYPWSVVNRQLFDAIMALVIASTTTAVAVAYLRRLEGRVLWRVLVAAVTWMATGVALDVLMLLMGTPRLSLLEYAVQRGVTYLMIPVIVFGLAYQRIRSTSYHSSSP